MKNRVITYLVIILPFILAACSLFRSLPDGNVNVEDNPDVIIGWNDINYDYERELGEKPALGTSNPDERKEDKKFSDKYSALLGVQLDGSEDRSLITEISEWLGTSYKYGTAEKHKGTDCSGFVSSVFRQAYGLELQRSSYAMAVNSDSLSSDSLKMGDLVFFCIKGGKVSHVGIYLKDGFFVHASTRAGVIVSSLGESYYKKYFCRAGRYNKS